MDGPREIELKLDLDGADTAALKKRVLPKLGARGGTSSRLVSIYFDTRDHALRDGGVSLRIRRHGERRVQTVKAGEGAGLFDRREWETDISGDEPAPDALAKTPVAALLRDSPLLPVFETDVERTGWTVETDRSAIEIALDEGRIVAGSASEAIAELELELKRGAPSELFDLARKLEVRSLRPGVRAKAERGYLLAGGKPPREYKAEPVALSRFMTTAEAFAAIVRACIRQYCLNEPLFIATRAPEPLHQARVAIRRLRSALTLFKSVVADEEAADIRARLKGLSRQMGEVRSFDVFLQQTVRPEMARDADEPGLPDFISKLEERREQAALRLVRTLQSPSFRRFLLDLLAWSEAGPWRVTADPSQRALRDCPVGLAASPILVRRRDRLRKRGRHLARLDPPSRHRARIAAKQLRYASEFFSALNRRGKERRRHTAFVDAMEDLQEALGELNDIQTGHRIAADFARREKTDAGAALFAAGHLSAGTDARTAPLLDAAGKAYRKFVRARRFWASWPDA